MAIQYWVAKARPENNKLSSLVRRGGGHWWWSRARWNASPGDRVFLWSSSPRLRVEGLAEADRATPWRDGGRWRYRLKYVSRLLPDPVGIEELRPLRVFRQAEFLMPARMGTFYPATPREARALYRLLLARNPFLVGQWKELDGAGSRTPRPARDVLEATYYEGGKRVASHLRIERRRNLVLLKKAELLNRTGALRCEVCGFDFCATYGDLGWGFCEVHHIRPLSHGVGRRTSLGDLAVLCANCHRMTHRGWPKTTLACLRRRVVAWKKRRGRN
jgi:5-methylcytosine-specific restriction endonuclease McrA